MRNGYRRDSVTTSIRAILRAALLVSLIAGIGCESAPMRAFRGARHYAAGTEAIHSGDRIRAIEELEQAAVLVPHASEIQNNLGLAYWSEGRTQAARSAFETALELDCENRAARANLERLMSSRAESISPDVVIEGNEDGG